MQHGKYCYCTACQVDKLNYSLELDKARNVNILRHLNEIKLLLDDIRNDGRAYTPISSLVEYLDERVKSIQTLVLENAPSLRTD